MEFKTEQYTVTHIRQTEVQDIFEVIFTDGRETQYLTFPRTMELSTEEAAEWIEN